MKQIFVTPGENAFFTHSIRNGTGMQMVYTIKIADPDETFFRSNQI